MERPTTSQFQKMPLQFARIYKIPKAVGTAPVHRRKEVVAIVRPYCSPDAGGPKYEQYCRQSLMQHVPFRHLNDLLGGCATYAEAFAVFLQSGSVPPSLVDDIYRLQMLQQQSESDADRNQVLLKIPFF